MAGTAKKEASPKRLELCSIFGGVTSNLVSKRCFFLLCFSLIVLCHVQYHLTEPVCIIRSSVLSKVDARTNEGQDVEI